MKKRVSILLFVASSLLSFAQSSDLDATFGQSGVVITTTLTSDFLNFGGSKAILNSDNTLFLFGVKDQASGGSDKMSFVSKLNFNGSPVTAFGSVEGRYQFGGYTQNRIPKTINKLSTGEIVFTSVDYFYSGGFYGQPTTYIQKLSTSGSLSAQNVISTYIPYFTFDFYTFQASSSVLVTATDGILLGGKFKPKQAGASASTYNSAPFIGFIASVNSATNLVSSGWGTAGVLSLPGVSDVVDLKLSGTNLFALGIDGSTQSGRIFKINSSGGLVTAFGGTGYINVSANIFSKIAVDASGNPYLLYPGNKTVAKYSGTDGAIVTAWGSSGFAATTISGYGSASNSAMVFDNASRLVVASKYGNDVLVTRLNTSGQIDGTFSGDGKGYSQGMTGLVTEVNDVLTDANNDVFVSGKSLVSGHSAYRAFTMKMKSNIPMTGISVSVSSLTGFITTYGAVSNAFTYSVNGSNLISNINITAPNNAEISLNGSTYTNTLSLTPSSGTVANTVVYIRLKSNASSGTITGSISHSSNGAPSRTVSIFGNINKAVLTVIGINSSKTYNTPNPQLGYSISGFKNNETEGVISGNVTLTTTAIISSNEGTYPIYVNASGLSSTNYSFNTISGILTVTKEAANLAITSANTGTVGGVRLLTFTSNSAGTVTWSIISGTGANITGGNTLNMTAIGNITIRASQAATTNYASKIVDQVYSITASTVPSLNINDFTFVFTGTGTITLPVTSNSPGNIFFNEVAWGAGGLQIYSISQSPTMAVQGTGYTVFNVFQAASAPFGSITKTITVTGLKGQSTTSITGPNGILTAGNTYGISDGGTGGAGPRKYSIIEGQHGTINTSTGSNFRATVPGVIKVRLERADGTDYFGSSDERSFVFNPAANSVSFSPSSAINVAYGDAPFTISGLLTPNANIRSTVLWSLDVISPNPDAVQITSEGLITLIKPGQVLVKATVPAYDQYGESGAFKTVNIAKRNVTLVGINASREYGEPEPIFDYNIFGLTQNDIITEKFTGAPNITPSSNSSSPVGNYTVSYLFTGYLNSNYYNITEAKNAVLSVTKAPLTIKPDEKTIKYGQALPTFTYTITGFKLGETASVVSGSPQMGVSTILGIGSYPINVTTTGLSATNYYFNAESGVLNVEKAVLTVTAINASKTYGQANPTFTYSISGFVNGDNASAITGTPTFATSASTGSNAGVYILSINGAGMSANNYDFVFKNGTFTINKANLTVSGGTYSRNYGSANPTFVPTFSGYVNGDNAGTAFSGSPSITTTAINTSNAATYTLFVSQGTLSSTNYNFIYVNGQMIVNKVVISASVMPASRKYGEANPTFSANYTGFVLSDNASVFTGAPNLNTSANATSPVGTYIINFGLGTLSATNYSFSTSNGVLTITQAVLTVSALNASNVYGENNPSFAHTIIGFKNGESVAVVSGLPTLSSSANAASNVGTYPISVNVAAMSATNYSFIGSSGTLTITKADRSITITSPSTGRVGTTVSLTGTVNPSGTITWSVLNGTGSASINTNQLTLNSVGVVTVTASVASDANFNAASATQLYTITNLTVPTIVFGNVSKTFTDAPFQLNATSNSEATKVYSVLSSTPANIVHVSPSGMVTILGAGAATLQVSQSEDGGFAATSQSAQLTIAKKQVGIQFVLDSQTGVVGSTLTFSGYGVVGNAPIVWDVVNESGSASLSGYNLHLLSEGTVQLRATIVEDENYLYNQAFRVITITGLTPIGTNIQNTKKWVEFYVYPNPNRGIFSLKTDKLGLMKIMDFTGRIVYGKQLSDFEQVFSVNLPSGAYLIELNSKVLKLIIE